MTEEKNKDGQRTTYKKFKDQLYLGARLLEKWKRRAKIEYDYYACEQWPKKAKEELRKSDRAPVVFNQVFPVVNRVAGTENTNRFQGKLLPRTIDDQGFTDMMNKMLSYERDQVDAEFAESDSFLDTAICGVGATEFRRDYRQSIYGRTWVENLSPFDLLWDPNARKRNMTDGKWIIQLVWMPREEAKRRWPDHAKAIQSSVNNYHHGIPGGATHYNAWIVDGRVNFYDRDNDEVLVHRYLYKDSVFVIISEDRDGSIKEFTEEEWSTLTDRLEEAGEQVPVHTKVPRDAYYQAYYLSELELEDELLPVQDSFPIKFITGFKHRKEGRVEWFGLMRPMIDPQLWANKMLSQLIYIVSTAPKGAMVAEQGVFKNITEMRREWAKPNPVILVRDGAIADNSIRIIEAKYPQAQDRIFNMAMEAVPRTVGLSAYDVGAVSNLSRTATSVVEAASTGSMVRMSILFDSLKLYRKHATGTHLEYIRKFTPEGTVVRVTEPGKANSSPVPFKREWVESFEFDVVLDEVPETTNQQQELWDSLQQTQSLQLLLDFGVITANEIPDLIPNVPETLRNQMRINAQRQDQVGQLAASWAAGDTETAQQILDAMVAQQQGAEAPQETPE